MANLIAVKQVGRGVKRVAGAVGNKVSNTITKVKTSYRDAVMKSRTTPSYKKAQKRMKSMGY
jgi:exoribonuclease R